MASASASSRRVRWQEATSLPLINTGASQGWDTSWRFGLDWGTLRHREISRHNNLPELFKKPFWIPTSAWWRIRDMLARRRSMWNTRIAQPWGLIIVRWSERVGKTQNNQCTAEILGYLGAGVPPWYQKSWLCFLGGGCDHTAGCGEWRAVFVVNYNDIDWMFFFINWIYGLPNSTKIRNSLNLSVVLIWINKCWMTRARSNRMRK